jgi:hypothetical protein
MGGTCSTHARDEKCIQYFGWEHEGKRPLGSHRRRREDNIRMDLREIRWEGVDWMHLAQDRDQWRDVGKTVVNLQVSLKKWGIS